MKDIKQLIHMHKINSNTYLCTIVYNDYLDEIHYIKIMECLFNYNFNKNIILLPFSINLDSNVVIFYNIYKIFNFKKLNKILSTLKTLEFKNISYLYLNSKTSSKLTPSILPSYFNKYGNNNIDILNSYLEVSNYKICNLNKDGIIK